MDTLRTSVFVLFVLSLLVSSTEAYLTEPVICYILDGFLVLYCIIATALLLREKFSNLQSEAVGDSACQKQEANDAIYQDLQIPEGTDAYQVIETKGRIQARKKKNTQVNESLPAEGRDKDAYESLMPRASAPPLPAQ
ncbi:CD247 antigen like isoform X2 [Centroberyx affinis]|uniref:CD247 antigen like isoform X2 n=1 Tax=Centroberyx affinis TaxID=166261 RepID=UPI003A5C407F